MLPKPIIIIMMQECLITKLELFY